MIKFSHVMKKYENITPIKDINYEIKEGEIVSIIGPSGTGKSTLLRMINGLEKPTSGKIYVDDIEVNDKNKKEITKKVSMLFQNYNLFNHLSIIENLMIAQVEILKRSKQEAYDKSIELLKEVGLLDKENSYPHELSGGQKQRIALARALAMDTKYLLLDEPTAALDPKLVSEVKELILKTAKMGKTILLVAHSMKLTRDVSDRVIYLDEGIIYEEGTAKEIFENPKKINTQYFVKNQRTIEIVINNLESFEDNTKELIEFCTKHNISLKQSNKLLLVFEEVVRQILFEKYERPEIIFRVKNNKDGMNITVRYKGEKFNIIDTKNEISLKVVKGLVSDIKYSFSADDEYKNVVEMEI